MSDTDNTYECGDCGRSVQNGKVCFCKQSQLAKTARPGEEPANLTEPDEVEIVDD